MTVYTVFTGGTISCSRTGGALSPDAKNGYLLLDLAKQAGVEAAFITTQPYAILSENLTADRLRALRACLEKAIKSGYDRIIVTHGTDTLAYAAAYLDYVLGASAAAIVLVSANYPLSDSRSNGVQNFVDAARFLESSGEKGVFVAYRNTGDAFTAIHRGREVMPQAPCEDSLFSLFDSPFGCIRDGAFCRNADRRERDREDLSDCELNGRVIWLRAHVGMTCPDIPKNTKAVLLEGYHSGTLPTADPEFRAFCLSAAEMEVPIFLTGDRGGFDYESKALYRELGIRVLPPMSPTAAYVRVWLASNQQLMINN